MNCANDQSDMKELLQLARKATAASAAILEQGWERRSVPVTKVGRDIKLAEDRASERVIREFLSKRSGLAVLGEEEGWAGMTESSDLHWVIDPLDGSYNYHRNIPLYAVSVALCRGRTPVLGVIRDPQREETFSGGPGIGLFRNGNPIAASATTRDILATGFPVRADVERTLSKLATSITSFNKIRMIGSAALSLAWVAIGRFDGYEEDGIMWWDVAAGLALADAAGSFIDISGDGVGPLRIAVTRMAQ